MMKWKQFLTPVKSLDAEATKRFIDEHSDETFTLLDVRQLNEYEQGHLPGAKLIPLPDLTDRLDELEKEKTQVVYCAVGGRSRIAAQMLAGKGFKQVINVAGGFKAWDSETAIGDETQGMALFSGDETPQETLITAFSLEQGLREFYIAMTDKVKDEAAKKLFTQLADIEIKHQDRIFEHYLSLSDETTPSRETFESQIVSEAMEGGMTSQEYAQRFNPDWESVTDIISLAMSIEAQALDMYSRAATQAKSNESKKVLTQIAQEERSHLQQLGKLMETIV